MGKDTHALSGPAQRTALEVLAANNVQTLIQRDDGVTPTPVISRAILVHNRGRKDRLADGIVITPVAQPAGGRRLQVQPAPRRPGGNQRHEVGRSSAPTSCCARSNADVKRVPFATAIEAATTHEEDFVLPYVKDLRNVIDMEAIRAAGLKLGVDPLGGAALPYWEPINSIYGLDITVVNPKLDPTFSFMTVDHDGKVRMDCSSPYAMAGLVRLKDQYRVAFGNDPDSDRHGIVTPSAGLMNPNHYLAVAINYLLTHRPGWGAQSAVGKTLVSSSMIDRVVSKLGRRLAEVPVGFKYFAPGPARRLRTASAGRKAPGRASCARTARFGRPTRTASLMDLLAAEITARTGKDPGEHFQALVAEFGTPYYTRIDAPATPEQKARLEKLSPEAVKASDLAGEPITAKLTRAPGNNEPIGGLKVVTANGWFAARPSGTENLYKVYAESFRDEQHLEAIVAEAQTLVLRALNGAG